MLNHLAELKGVVNWNILLVYGPHCLPLDQYQDQFLTLQGRKSLTLYFQKWIRELGLERCFFPEHLRKSSRIQAARDPSYREVGGRKGTFIKHLLWDRHFHISYLIFNFHSHPKNIFIQEETELIEVK